MERWANILVILVIAWHLINNNKNSQYCESYLLRLDGMYGYRMSMSLRVTESYRILLLRQFHIGHHSINLSYKPIQTSQTQVWKSLHGSWLHTVLVSVYLVDGQDFPPCWFCCQNMNGLRVKGPTPHSSRKGKTPFFVGMKNSFSNRLHVL